MLIILWETWWCFAWKFDLAIVLSNCAIFWSVKMKWENDKNILFVNLLILIIPIISQMKVLDEVWPRSSNLKERWGNWKWNGLPIPPVMQVITLSPMKPSPRNPNLRSPVVLNLVTFWGVNLTLLTWLSSIPILCREFLVIHWPQSIVSNLMNCIIFKGVPDCT